MTRTRVRAGQGAGKVLSSREFLQIWGESANLQTLEVLRVSLIDIRDLDSESKSAHLTVSWTMA